VPGLATSSLEARIERAVHAAIAGRRAELEQLIRTRLDDELQALAGELLADRLAEANGNGAVPSEPRTATAAELRRRSSEPCSRCGVEPRMPGRTIGRRCKTRHDAERTARQRAERRELTAAAAAVVDEEPPRTAVGVAGELA
jgi:hypothetical protein